MEATQERQGQFSSDISEALKARAKAQFASLMLGKVKFICEQCWPGNLKGSFETLNHYIAAAQAFGVTNASEFKPEEIGGFVTRLSPLRTLEMKDECWDFMRGALEAHRVDLTIFPQFVPSRQAS